MVGLHRSGTTAFADEIIKSSGGEIFYHSVEDVVRSLKGAEGVEKLNQLIGQGADRGIDDLRLAPKSVEEYGWLINSRHPFSNFSVGSHGKRLVEILPQDVVQGDRKAVLKNPWDTSRRSLKAIQAALPDVGFTLVWRDPSAVTASLADGWMRYMSSEQPYVCLLLSGNQYLFRFALPRKLYHLMPNPVRVRIVFIMATWSTFTGSIRVARILRDSSLRVETQLNGPAHRAVRARGLYGQIFRVSEWLVRRSFQPRGV